MVGRATRLVLYLVLPCLMALGVGAIGARLGDGAPSPDRPMSRMTFGKFDALSVCVESISGSRQEADALLDEVSGALEGLGVPTNGRFTLPATVAAGCPGRPAHFGLESQASRVAANSTDPYPRPSAYHLHIYVMPRTTLRMLAFEPDLIQRRAAIEEYSLDDTAQGGAQIGVTFGLYATPEELRTKSNLAAFFVHSLGLRPPTTAMLAPGP